MIFHENFFATLALKLRAAVAMPLAYLGGGQSSAGVSSKSGDGFDAVALGRALIFDPGFVDKLIAAES